MIGARPVRRRRRQLPSSRRSSSSIRTTRCWSSAPTSTSSTTSPAELDGRRSSRARRRTRNASGSTTSSAAASHACWCLEGGQLLDRPARGGRRGADLRDVRIRQEEAQRLGRVLRPKHDGRQAHFYTVVARDTLDAEYAAHRQRFLAEQGYAYTITDADDLLRRSNPVLAAWAAYVDAGRPKPWPGQLSTSRMRRTRARNVGAPTPSSAASRVGLRNLPRPTMSSSSASSQVIAAGQACG